MLIFFFNSVIFTLLLVYIKFPILIYHVMYLAEYILIIYLINQSIYLLLCIFLQLTEVSRIATLKNSVYDQHIQMMKKYMNFFFSIGNLWVHFVWRYKSFESFDWSINSMFSLETFVTTNDARLKSEHTGNMKSFDIGRAIQFSQLIQLWDTRFLFYSDFIQTWARMYKEHSYLRKFPK